MTTEHKVRVVAPMPGSKKPIRKSITIALAFVAWICSYKVLIYLRTPNIAEPMKGECISAPLRRYTKGDLDGKICVWQHARFWCVYAPETNVWNCEVMEQK